MAVRRLFLPRCRLSHKSSSNSEPTDPVAEAAGDRTTAALMAIGSIKMAPSVVWLPIKRTAALRADERGGRSEDAAVRIDGEGEDGDGGRVRRRRRHLRRQPARERPLHRR